MEDNKKKSNILKYIGISLICFLIVFACIFFFISNSKSSKESTVRLEDDFYENVNYTKLKKMKIPSMLASWSTFHDAQQKVNDKKSILIEKIIKDKNYSNKNMESMVELFSDFDTRNKLGLSELQKYFDSIDNAKTMKEFNKISIDLDHDLNANGLVSVSISSDMYNPNKNVLYFVPIVAEDNFEVYLISKYSRYADEYRTYRKNLLKLAGWSDEKINSFSSKLEDFIKEVQSKSKNLSEINDRFMLYNKYTLDDIKENIKNLPIIDYIDRYNFNNQEYYVFYDFDHYKALDELYTIDNLDFFKDFQKYSILSHVAVTYTTKDFYQAAINISNAVSGNNFSFDEQLSKTITSLKESYIGDDLAKEYERLYFSDKDRQFVYDLVDEIKEYYKEVIKDSDWLSDDTKVEAINKLEKIKVNVGFIEKDLNVEVLDVVSKKDGGTLLSNYILETRNSFDRLADELNMETDGSIAIDTFEVNAFYNPRDNSINFTAAFKEIYGDEDNYYKLLAYIGTVISHEISHAFDVSGSKYDVNGNAREWWNSTDRENYERLASKISAYYDKYSIMGFNVNGEKTLDENISDLAAMKCMLSILEKKNASVDDYKLFFEAYADLWASKSNKDAMENQILTDSHSPNKVRVNAVLSSMDKFYEVYNITENDKMYVAKEDRVSLW